MKDRKFIGILLAFLMFASIFAIVSFTGGAEATIPSQAVMHIPVGNSPYQMAYDPQNNYIYVANSWSNNVSIINGLTNTVVGNITLGSRMPMGITYDSQNGYLYVTDAESGVENITVINGATNEIIKNISIGSSFSSVFALYDPDNGYIYITGNDGVCVLNPSTNTIFNISAGLIQSWGIAYDPDNKYLYVTDDGSGLIAIIDTQTNTLVKTLNVGQVSTDYAVYDPYNKYVYASNYRNNIIYVINATTNTFAGQNITLSDHPNGMVIDPDNHYLYVVFWASLVIIDPSTNTQIGSLSTISGDKQGTCALYDPYNKYIYVSYNWYVDVFQVLDTYSVTFTENGLPSGTTWYVNLSSGQSFSGTGTTITFSEPNGTYSYTIATMNKSYAPSSSSGSFTVNGANVNIAITFTPITYTVTFIENGLPSGTSWSVTFNGNIKSSNTTTISYTGIVNGSYSFTVGSITWYKVSPSSGIINVNGANVNQTITFTPSLSTTAVEVYSCVNSSSIFTGFLPEAEAFTVGSSTVNVNFVTLYLSGSGSINFSIGTSLWGADVLANTTVNVFSNQYWYNITIPIISLTGGTTYYLNVYQVSGNVYWGYTSSPSSSSKNYVQDYWYQGSTVTHDNSYPNIYIIGYVFTIYKITFTENGLPSGTTWYVNLSNEQSFLGNSTTITFTEPNGTYSYIVETANKSYSTNSSSGTFTVNGTGINVTITFNLVTYTITFTETGLPSETTWYVNLSNEQSFLGNGTKITFSEPNGTYSYSIETANKNYTPNPSSGTFTVNGANVNLEITFNQIITGPAFPSANITAPSVVALDTIVILSGKNSTASAGATIINFTWNIYAPNNNHYIKYGETISIYFNVAGAYTINLTVKDSANKTNSTSIKINAISPSIDSNIQISYTLTVLSNGYYEYDVIVNAKDNVSIVQFLASVDGLYANATLTKQIGYQYYYVVKFNPNAFGYGNHTIKFQAVNSLNGYNTAITYATFGSLSQGGIMAYILGHIALTIVIIIFIIIVLSFIYVEYKHKMIKKISNAKRIRKSKISKKVRK